MPSPGNMFLQGGMFATMLMFILLIYYPGNVIHTLTQVINLMGLSL